jgi:hypothetical protein
MPFVNGSPALVASAVCFGCRSRFSHLGPRNEHASRRIAGLGGVTKACLGIPLGGIFEIGIVQNDVGRLAAEFLIDSLHSGRGS